MCKITHGAIILADIPYTEYNPHQHHGKHFYIVLSNQFACTYSPVVQAVPFSSNVRCRLPVQVEVEADCFRREVSRWRNNSPYCRRTYSNRVNFVAP